MSSVFDLEDAIVKLLYTDLEVRDKVVPFLVPTVFDRRENKRLVSYMIEFMGTFNKFPTFKDTKLALCTDDESDVMTHLKKVYNTDLTKYTPEHLMTTIEVHYREKLIANVAMDIITSLSEGNSQVDYTDALKTAQSFTFDTSIGMDAFGDGERLYDFMHSNTNVVPSGIKNLDRCISGGFKNKTLNLFMAGTNVGKSLIMCSLAVKNVYENKKVLYISCEMTEENIAERLYTNASNITTDELRKLDKPSFLLKMKEVKQKLAGKLMVKEYATGSLTVPMIRRLLKEYRDKLGFVPDIIYVDYLGIMAPSTTRKNANSYESVMQISVELRGLAMDCDVPIVSGLQTNRGGLQSSSLEITDIADSVGTAYTADVLVAVTQSDDHRDEGKYLFSVIKNRNGQKRLAFTVLVDYSYMRIDYDQEGDDYAKGDEKFNKAVSKFDNDISDKALDVAVTTMNKNTQTLKKKKFVKYE